MNIVRATKSDCNEIADIFNKAHKPFESIWNEEEWECFGEDTIKTEDDCNSMIESREVYCAKEDNKIIAYVSFRKKNNYVIWISELYVDPNIQKSGVGTNLIKFVEDYSLKEGCNVVALETHNLADWAKNFYLKNGYEVVNQKMEEEPYIHILDKPPVEGRPIFAKIVK